jgi:hypothetical protein
MIVGKTGSGKSTAWRTLAAAMGKLAATPAGAQDERYQKVSVHTINPLVGGLAWGVVHALVLPWLPPPPPGHPHGPLPAGHPLPARHPLPAGHALVGPA